jgi:hypothetical protein
MRKTLLLFVSALLVACTPDTGGPDGPVDRGVYPEGPFGTEEGDVLAPLAFQRDTGEDYSFDADVYADESNRLLLLTTAAGWCTACIEEQGQLEAFHNDPEIEGLAIVVSIFEDQNFQPATPEVAAGWRETHSLSFDVIVDAENQLGDEDSGYYDPALTPMNMMVDIDTMEILRIQTGWDPSVIESIIEARLQ